jgi:hypothetical protein
MKGMTGATGGTGSTGATGASGDGGHLFSFNWGFNTNDGKITEEQWEGGSTSPVWTRNSQAYHFYPGGGTGTSIIVDSWFAVIATGEDTIFEIVEIPNTRFNQGSSGSSPPGSAPMTLEILDQSVDTVNPVTVNQPAATQIRIVPDDDRANSVWIQYRVTPTLPDSIWKYRMTSTDTN